MQVAALYDVLRGAANPYAVQHEPIQGRPCVAYSFIWVNTSIIVNNWAAYTLNATTPIASYYEPTGVFTLYMSVDPAVQPHIFQHRALPGTPIPFHLASMCIQHVVMLVALMVSPEHELSWDVCLPQLRKMEKMIEAVALSNDNVCNPHRVREVGIGPIPNPRHRSDFGMQTPAPRRSSRSSRSTQLSRRTSVTPNQGTQTDVEPAVVDIEDPPRVETVTFNFNLSANNMGALIAKAQSAIKDKLIKCISRILTAQATDQLTTWVNDMTMQPANGPEITEYKLPLRALMTICDIIYFRAAPLRRLNTNEYLELHGSDTQTMINLIPSNLYGICKLPKFSNTNGYEWINQLDFAYDVYHQNHRNTPGNTYMMKAYLLCEYVIDLVADDKMHHLCAMFNERNETLLNRHISENTHSLSNVLTFARLRLDPGKAIDRQFKEVRLDYASAPVLASVVYKPTKTAEPSAYLFGPYTGIFPPTSNIGLIVRNDARFGKVMEAMKQPNTDVILAAYGASGAGKTSFLVGYKPPPDTTGTLATQTLGLVPCICETIMTAHPALTINVVVKEYYGINGELLSESDADETQYTSNNIAHLGAYLWDRFITKRRTFATPNNPESSRSHLVATFTFSGAHVGFATLRVVDLAGFETSFQCSDKTLIKNMHEARTSTNDPSYGAAWLNVRRTPDPAEIPTFPTVITTKSDFTQWINTNTNFPMYADYDLPISDFFPVIDQIPDVYNDAYIAVLGSNHNVDAKKNIASAILNMFIDQYGTFTCDGSSDVCMFNRERLMMYSVASDLIWLGDMLTGSCTAKQCEATYTPYLVFNIDPGDKAALEKFIECTSYKTREPLLSRSRITNQNTSLERNSTTWNTWHKKITNAIKKTIVPQNELTNKWEAMFHTGWTDGKIPPANKLTPVSEGLFDHVQSILRAINKVTKIATEKTIKQRTEPLLRILNGTTDKSFDTLVTQIRRSASGADNIWRKLLAVYVVYQDLKRRSEANAHKRRFLAEQCDERNKEGRFIKETLADVQAKIMELIEDGNKELYPPYNSICGPQSLERASNPPRKTWGGNPRWNSQLLNIEPRRRYATFVMIGVANLTEGASKHPYLDISELVADSISEDNSQHLKLCKALRDRVRSIPNAYIVMTDPTFIKWEDAIAAADIQIGDDQLLRRLRARTEVLLGNVKVSNASSTIGVLEFLDSVAKFGTVEGICRIRNGNGDVFTNGSVIRAN